ncbi:hypothetical protein J1614_000472 [Plenodomus biglobosus]|nr:hypothetical protein J1614_000472 [Plenodomus biglobosus]
MALSVILYLLPASFTQCDCPCTSQHQPVHLPTWAAWSHGWTARTNECAKSSPIVSRSASSGIGAPTGPSTPNLIVPFDKANPKKVIGDGYTAQLSPTVSTVFVFDVDSVHQGKTCTLALHIPAAFDFPAFTPLHINAPGGVTVSRVGISRPIGSVASIDFGQNYNVASSPCEGGQEVGYQVDSVGGLTMDFFQMVNPPLGFFLLVG